MKNIKLFLSSTFDPNMVRHRDLFRNELRILLERELGQYGLYFYLYDFELGIPRYTAPQRVVRMCFQAIDKSNAFVGILGAGYGTPIRSFLKDASELEKLKRDYPMLAEPIEKNASMLELEFCYAMSSGNKSILFFLLKDFNRKRDAAAGLRMKRLISLIKKSGYAYREIADYGDIQHETLRWIRSISGVGASGESPSMLNAYAVRKTRYYVEDKQMGRVYRYLGGDIRKTLCIYGETGTGKTVMMSRLYLEHYAEGMCFAFIGCNAYTLSETILVLLRQVYRRFQLQEDELNQAYSESEYVQLFQETIRRMAAYPYKCSLFIDGIDRIRIMGAFSINEILPDRLPGNIKIVVTTSRKALVSRQKAVFLDHIPVKRHEFLAAMLYAEGKQGEKERIGSSRIFRGKRQFTPEYIYVFVSELIATAKYDTIGSLLFRQSLKMPGLAEVYAAFLQRLKRRFPGRDAYMEKILLCLCCTENGLTEKELVSLAGHMDKDILFFIYPYLEVTGEQRMLVRSSAFCRAIFLAWKIKREQVYLCRKHIVETCFLDAEEDPILGRELLHQLQYLQDEKITAKVMGNLQIVDSILYYDEEYAYTRLRKLQDFPKYLQSWSEWEVTENNHACMLTVINLEIENDMLENAERHLQEMLSLLEQGKIGQSYAGNIYNHLAVLYEKQFRHREARQYAEKSIQAAAGNGESPSRICDYKNILCRMCLDAGEYASASRMITGLLHTYHNPFYEESINRLRLKITYLNVCFHQGRIREYEKEFKWLYPRLRKIFSSGHPELVHVRIMHIYYLARTGRLGQALGQCRQVRDIVEGDERFGLKLCLAESEVYRQMGEWKKEHLSLQKAGRFLEEQGKKDTPAAILWYEKCMFYYMDTGHPWKAIKVGKRIRRLQGEGNESPLRQIDTMLNLGAAYECAGEYDAAMRHYGEAMDILEGSGAAPLKAADIYNQVGTAAQSMQKYRKAYDSYTDALKILEQSPGYETELKGVILNNIGQLMQEAKRPERALHFYGKALLYFREHFDGGNPQAANTLDNIGSIWDMKEEYEKAAAFHLRSLLQRWKKGGLYSTDTVTSFHNLARTWCSDKKMLRALAAEGMAVLSLSRQEISPEDYPVYMCMGEVLERLRLGHLAFQSYMQAFRLLRVKKEIVPETAEIYLIMATFSSNWESCPVSEKLLLKAGRILERKKERYRKDYELKAAIAFSLEKYYLQNGRSAEALKQLDYAEHILLSLPDQEDYADVYESIRECRTGIEALRE